jgi:uncharacterized protein (DUF58 family)
MVYMRKNRIIMAIFIIASGTFASFYGGNVPYAFFYLSICIPIIAYLYTGYVYLKLRIYQKVESHIVVKGDLTPYSFTIANEDFITYSSIKVNFLCDKSKIINADAKEEYCLLPGTVKTKETTIRCHYRGEYFVGVESVEITDLLYLFCVRYPYHSKLTITVLPRIVTLMDTDVIPGQKDIKNVLLSLFLNQNTMDIDSRPYKRGDSKRQINWKVTARQNALYSRKIVTDPKAKIILLMDMGRIKETELDRIIYEDYILEITLALAHYLMEHRTGTLIYYEQLGIQRQEINNATNFDLFYQTCVNLSFKSEVPLHILLSESERMDGENKFYIIITHLVTNELLWNLLKVREVGNELAVILISNDTHEEDNYKKELRMAGIMVKVITREDNMGEVLNL